MPEASTLCHELLSRLQQVHESVAALGPDDKNKVAFNRILVRFLRFLIKRPILVRLARSDAARILLRELHRHLDGIFTDVGVADSTQWETQWEAGCAQQRQELATLASKSPFMLASEVGGDRKLKETVLKLRTAPNLTQDDELHQLIHTAPDKVVRISHHVGLRMFTWFIAIEDIEYEDETLGLLGTFAEARRATWTHDGERQDVVVKMLFFDIKDEDDEEMFLNQLQFWNNLPKDENVLELVGWVPRELTPHRHLFWSLFLGVAKGLKHLHSHNIVHGGLKGSNILIGDENRAKIADFGFSCVRSLSLKLSDKGSKALSAAIRWKPRELLEESEASGPVEIPFGVEDDVVVSNHILGGGFPSRPDQASDEAWGFICRLCAVDFRARPSFDEVIEIIDAYKEKHTPVRRGGLELLPDVTSELVGEDTRAVDYSAAAELTSAQLDNELSRVLVDTVKLQCPECEVATTPGDSFCRMCGYFIPTDAAFA
ncbi:hypothetical protein PHYPSEUDO_014626 [Phytophthora pseudosyringae]|uniref:Protein kinase domain-containing protein n=1 Tax=Phytophthora pseudosyringae TaxID=221518 RepID=A0A8T1V6R2_9STRA|nr:hypothetical protein PHYPSEUDO_014626 [Phytophthora pseudosyringae]